MRILYYKLRAFGVKCLLRFLPRNQPLVFTGPGSSRALCRQISLLGHSTILLVTDEVLHSSGILNDIKQTLTGLGIGFHVFDGVRTDPAFEQVMQGEKILCSARCEAILAVGGGSVIDAAKLISLLHTNPGDLASFDGIQKARFRGPPLFVIPTTAGTGSEITPAAVITDDRTQRKVVVADGKAVPDFIAIDAELMKSMPPQVTAATGMDALTHAVESYLSRASSPATRIQARTAVKLIFGHLVQAWNNGDDITAREAMAMASFYAGSAFGRTSVGYAHGIAHQLGRVCGTPHGEANAMVLPEVLSAYGHCVHSRLAELALAVGLDRASATDEELASRFIQRISDMRRVMQMPESPNGLDPHHVNDIVKEAIAETGSLYPVPRYISSRELRGIVGDLAAKS